MCQLFYVQENQISIDTDVPLDAYHKVMESFPDEVCSLLRCCDVLIVKYVVSMLTVCRDFAHILPRSG